MKGLVYCFFLLLFFFTNTGWLRWQVSGVAFNVVLNYHILQWNVFRTENKINCCSLGKLNDNITLFQNDLVLYFGDIFKHLHSETPNVEGVLLSKSGHLKFYHVCWRIENPLVVYTELQSYTFFVYCLKWTKEICFNFFCKTYCIICRKLGFTALSTNRVHSSC